MSRRGKYSKLTDEVFDRILREVINDDNAQPCDVLGIPGVYEILSEHYNNDVLDRWSNDGTHDDDKS